MYKYKNNNYYIANNTYESIIDELEIFEAFHIIDRIGDNRKETLMVYIDEMCELCIIDLITGEKLTEERIEIIKNIFQDYFDKLYDLVDGLTNLHIIEYFYEKLKRAKEYCLENELFEALMNLNNFEKRIRNRKL